jgi:hypothetical protein
MKAASTSSGHTSNPSLGLELFFSGLSFFAGELLEVSEESERARLLMVLWSSLTLSGVGGGGPLEGVVGRRAVNGEVGRPGDADLMTLYGKQLGRPASLPEMLLT